MPSSRKLDILVVEDDADVAAFLVAALNNVGHAVKIASSGTEGMVRATGESYDLLILDRHLGDGIDGAQILEAVRHTGNTKPALFLSGLGELSDWLRGLQAGGDDYLVKPFTIDELTARIDALTKESSAPVG